MRSNFAYRCWTRSSKRPGVATRISTPSFKALTWRLGYSQGSNPIDSSQVLFNILAPGVIEKHITAGFTAAVADNQDLNFAVTRGLSHSVTGANHLEAPGQQTIELKMDQWIIAVGL